MGSTMSQAARPNASLHPTCVGLRLSAAGELKRWALPHHAKLSSD
jgi:hypothetical protein